MGTPHDLVLLMQAKDPAATSQEKATIFDLVKKSSMGELSSVIP